MEGIEGKVVVVTGASSGMGEAAARHLVARGASVVMAARRSDRIESLADELRGSKGRAMAFTADVSRREDMQRLVEAAIVRFGGIDVLVNNAGIMPLSSLQQLKVDEWDRMIDVNLKGVLYGIAAVLPHMQQRKAGHIITTASVAAHKVFPASAVYSATKYAVRALCEGLRTEVKPYNIRTTLVSPGAVRTELLEQISDGDVKSANQAFVDQVGISADSYARVVAFAISQPDDVDINEVIFRPVAQEL